MTREPSEPTKRRPPARSFQYKGLFPAIDEAVARLLRLPAASSSTWSTRSPAPPAGGSRLRDDAAAVRFHGLHARPDLRDWPLGQTLDFFKELKLTKRRSSRSPATCSARSATACSSWSMSASTT